MSSDGGGESTTEFARPLVSMVVTTKNEERNIENCLLSLVDQSYGRENIEIIVVDNYSIDRTLEIAKKHADIVETIGPERNVQRNHGMIDLSNGQYLMWIDADMILSTELLEKCLQVLLNSNYIALRVPEIIIGRDVFSKIRRFERSFYDHTVIDGARILKKSSFIHAGGFPEEYLHGPADWELDKSLSLSGEIGYLGTAKEHKTFPLGKYVENHGIVDTGQCAIYHNESDITFFRFIKKKAFYSHELLPYIQKWGKNDPDVKKQVGFLYRFLLVFIENGKWRKMIKRFDLYLLTIGVRSLTGIGYLWVTWRQKLRRPI